MHRLIRKYRSYLLLIATALILGITAGAVWMAATGQYRPPWWVTIAGGFVLTWVSVWIEGCLTGYLERREEKAAARTAPTADTPEGAA
ncbi:hypothetical protein [Streptomyces sp. NPDC005407]|uniref:hypothetical protein n=1 Tax=Streptomyces sp. NPDC005407 TaxID=3155340 RepID=UPI00339EA93F